MNNEEVPDALKGHLSKFKGYGARLALVLHYLRTVGMGLPEENEVDGITVHQAHKLVSYFYAHARRVHDALGTDEETDDARRVLAWITRHRPEQFKRYDAHEGLKGQKRFGKIEALDRPLDRLERHGYIRRLERPKPTNGPGRPPVPVYAVNPLLYQRPVNSENPENEESP